MEYSVIWGWVSLVMRLMQWYWAVVLNYGANHFGLFGLQMMAQQAAGNCCSHSLFNLFSCARLSFFDVCRALLLMEKGRYFDNFLIGFGIWWFEVESEFSVGTGRRFLWFKNWWTIIFSESSSSFSIVWCWLDLQSFNFATEWHDKIF